MALTEDAEVLGGNKTNSFIGSLYTTNPTSTGLGLNPDLPGDSWGISRRNPLHGLQLFSPVIMFVYVKTIQYRREYWLGRMQIVRWSRETKTVKKEKKGKVKVKFTLQ